VYEFKRGQNLAIARVEGEGSVPWACCRMCTGGGAGVEEEGVAMAESGTSHRCTS
jgi:hypothetical protein